MHPTGEIANILAGGLIGGVMGGIFGFAGPAFSQISSREEFRFRRAAGSAVNGVVIGSVRGALLGSGAGLALTLASNGAAGVLGSVLEQGIGTGRADIGKSIAGGLSNAVSGAVYGNMPLKNLADAAGRGALSGVALSAIDYLFGTGGTRESAGRRAPGGNGRSDGLSPYAQRRDPSDVL